MSNVDGAIPAIAVLHPEIWSAGYNQGRKDEKVEIFLEVEKLADWFCCNYDHPEHEAFLQPDHCGFGLTEAQNAIKFIELN